MLYTEREWVLITGLQVSKLILGCMQYGSGDAWMISDHEEGMRQMKYAYDQGINVGCFVLLLYRILPSASSPHNQILDRHIES